MSIKTPPRVLEQLLLILLPARDRETVSGDLMEDYREDKLPRLGRVRANYWYLRQVVSFLPNSIQEGALMKRALTMMCWFGMITGAWLGVMENILRHQGYEIRTLVAMCIVAQGVATLIWLALRAGVVFGAILAVGAVGMIWLGTSSIRKMLTSPHFEGFVVIVGMTLVLQGFATLVMFLTTRNRPVQN